MPPPRSIAGQASAEYVALLAVVGAIVAGAAAVGSPPLAGLGVAAAVRHGICLVAGGVCTPREARAAGLAPCLVHARTDRERLGGRLLVVRLGRGDALLVERRSDGSAAVSFTDGASGGATVGVGLRIPAGRGSAPAAGGRAVQRRADVGVPELRRGGGLRAPLVAAGVARRRGEAGAAQGLPDLPKHRAPRDAGGRCDLQRGRGVRRVRRGGARRRARGRMGAEEEGEAGAILGRRRRAATGASRGTTASTSRRPGASAR